MDPSKQEQNGVDESDQRYLPRWEVKNRLLFQSEDYTNPQEGQTRDMSCSGVSFSTNLNLNAHQKIKLTIYLSPHTAVKVSGQVIWIKSLAGENQVGVSFFNTSQKTQDLILEHAFELKHKSVVGHWYNGWNGKTPDNFTQPS